MKSKKVLLDSTDVIVRGKGEIDIGNRTIKMVAAPQAKREKLLSMSTPIAVTGPWNDLQIGVGGAGFVGTLFRWYMTLIYVPYKWITGERFPQMAWRPATERRIGSLSKTDSAEKAALV